MNRDKLIALSHELDGDWLSMYEVLKDDFGLRWWEPKQNEMSYVKAVTIYDEAYPKALLDLRQPPFVLYYEGDLALLDEPLRAVMGHFNPSEYALSWAKKLEGPVMATLDHGISGIVLKESSVGIAAFGLEMPFSKHLVAKGLVISEFPPNVPFSWRRYWRANHLLLELGEALNVFELGQEDIRLKMIDSFMRDGLPVFVLPDRWGVAKSAGGMGLLGRGASVMDS